MSTLSGVLQGVSGMLGVIPGFISPLVVAYFTHNNVSIRSSEFSENRNEVIEKFITEIEHFGSRFFPPKRKTKNELVRLVKVLILLSAFFINVSVV